jgi:hypothetical protein
MREDDRARERLVGELGDVWHYWTRLCAASGTVPAELPVRNRAKIEHRVAVAATAGEPGGPSGP